MPNIGNLFFNSSIKFRQMPASLGVQGPGDSTIAFGLRFEISSIEIALLNFNIPFPYKILS